VVELQRISGSSRSPSDVIFVRNVKGMRMRAGRCQVSSGVHVEPAVPSSSQCVAFVLRCVASAFGSSRAGQDEYPRRVLVSAFRSLRRTASTTKRVRLADRFAGSRKSAFSCEYPSAAGKIGSVTRLSYVWRSVRGS
jgi:hypothetical protein